MDVAITMRVFEYRDEVIWRVEIDKLTENRCDYAN